MIQIDIRKLTQEAHGMDKFENIQPIDMSRIGMNATGRDSLGRPYFMDVILSSEKMDKTFRLPFEPLVSFSKEKKLIITQLAGGDGADEGIVIEDVAPGSFSISIKGILMETDRNLPRYPVEQVEQLYQFCESREALDVQCDLFELFGIRKMVVKGYKIDEMQGQPYSQKYTLNCISYRDFLADLKYSNL